MPATPEASLHEKATSPVAAPEKGVSGKRVVLVNLVLIPLIVVPLLLSGPSLEEQVCLRTLEQRRVDFFTIGSFPVTAREWKPMEGWPPFSGRFPVPEPFVKPLREAPSQYAKEAFGEGGDHVWSAERRSIPMAFVFDVDNKRVLADTLRDVVDARLLMAAVLDPANGNDREIIKRLDGKLSVGVPSTEDLKKLGRRGVRERQPSAGEQGGREVLNAFFDALESEEPKEAFREGLGKMAAELGRE